MTAIVSAAVTNAIAITTIESAIATIAIAALDLYLPNSPSAYQNWAAPQLGTRAIATPLPPCETTPSPATCRWAQSRGASHQVEAEREGCRGA